MRVSDTMTSVDRYERRRQSDRIRTSRIVRFNTPLQTGNVVICRSMTRCSLVRIGIVLWLAVRSVCVGSSDAQGTPLEVDARTPLEVDIG